MMVAAVVAATLAVPPESIEAVVPVCRHADRHGFCTDDTMHMQLSRDRPVISARVRVGVNKAFTMHFPVGMQVPKENIIRVNEAVFHISEYKDHTISVEVVIPDAARKMAQQAMSQGQPRSPAELVLDTPGNLRLSSRRGFLIDVQMRVGRPEQSVSRLFFTSTQIAEEQQLCATQLEQERLDAKAQMDQERLELTTDRAQVVREEAGIALMDVGRCRGWHKTAFADQVRLEVHRVCQLGQMLYVVVRIKNRARSSLFRLGSIVLSDGNDDEDPWEPADVVASFRRLQADGSVARFAADQVELDFNQSIMGTVSVPTSEEAPSVLGVTIAERGGQQRSVSVRGVSL